MHCRTLSRYEEDVVDHDVRLGLSARSRSRHGVCTAPLVPPASCKHTDDKLIGAQKRNDVSDIISMTAQEF